MNYAKVKGPCREEGQTQEAALKAYKSKLSQEFARIGAEDSESGGAQFSSFKPDGLACEEGVIYCVKISGSPTKNQRIYLKSLSPQ